MGRWIAIAAAAFLWCALVFYISFRMTFPSDAVEDRIRVEVHTATAGQNELMLSNVRPWWTGLAADNVALVAVGRARAGVEPEREVLVSFDTAKVRTTLFSLLRNQPRVMGEIALGPSDVDFDVTLGMNKRGTALSPRNVELSAPDIRVADLLGLAGLQMEATGAIELEIDLVASEGIRDAEGDIRINGRDVLIASIDPSLTQGMDLGREIPLDEIDLHLAIREGRAEFRNGRIQSPLADIEIEGDLSLREDLSRSGMDILIKADLGEELDMFKAFLKSAEQPNGEFHYQCSGLVSRPSCRASRGSTRTSGSRTRTTERGERLIGNSAEDRERRKQSVERLKASAERRRAERDAARGEGAEGDEGEELEEIGYEDDEEDLEDEEQEEEGLDEEELEVEDEQEFEEP